MNKAVIEYQSNYAMILPRELLLDCDTSVVSLGHNFRPLDPEVSLDQDDLIS